MLVSSANALPLRSPRNILLQRFSPRAEVSIPASLAEAAGVKPLPKPATGNDGRPLNTKLRVPKGAVSADHIHPEASASDAQEG